jgi:predicted NBD/HSP70 family sugar kinase
MDVLHELLKHKKGTVIYIMILGSKELIRDMNSKLVLETIIHCNPISRASISKKLGLTKATISAIVQDLINAKLVIEIGSDDTSLGRKPILLNFNQKAGYAICVDIGVSVLSCMICDLLGEHRSVKQVKTPKESVIVSCLTDLIESMEQNYEKLPYGLIGITLGIHGVTYKDEILFTPYYNLVGLDLKQQLSEYFSVPIVLENEANLSAFGERAYLSNHYHSLANISIHTGVGLGVILNDELFNGNSGHAGELGHTIVEMNGRLCPCGNYGCLEQYTSERALLMEYSHMTGKKEVTWEDFLEACKQQERSALELLDQFVSYMCICINNLLNSLSPEIVIINSSLTNTFPWLISRLVNGLTSKVLTHVPIIPSLRRDSSILLGGVSVAVRNFLGVKNILFHD